MTRTNRPTEAQVDEARRVLRADYYGSVCDIAEDIISRCKSGEIADRDALAEDIHQTVDGSYWVIYTHANFQCLMASDNDSAYVDDLGTDGLVDDTGINWPAMAFKALEQDVYQQLEAQGLDVNDYEGPESLKGE